MPLYECDCGFGSKSGATDVSITRHLKGSHYRDVNVTSGGSYYCNDCTTRGGSGRRFDSFEELKTHLEDRHSMDCVNHSSIIPYDEMLFQCSYCDFGNASGASRNSLIHHIRGVHMIDARNSASGYHCNDCTRSNGNGRRFDSFEDLIEHLDDVHGYDGAVEFQN